MQPRTWVRDDVGGFYTKIQWGQECWDERKRMSKQILWRGSSKGWSIPPRSHTSISQVPGTFEWWRLKSAEFGVWSNSFTNWVWNLHVDEFLALHHHHPHQQHQQVSEMACNNFISDTTNHLKLWPRRLDPCYVSRFMFSLLKNLILWTNY